MRREFRWTNRVTKAQGRKRERYFPLLPRYLFIGMNAQTPGWERVLCFVERMEPGRGGWKQPIDGPVRLKPRRGITGIITMNGEPYRVPHDSRGKDRPGLRDLMWRFAGGDFNAPDAHRHMATHREFEVGDRVTTMVENMTGVVIEITDTKARVLVELFGGQHEVTSDLARLSLAS